MRSAMPRLAVPRAWEVVKGCFEPHGVSLVDYRRTRGWQVSPMAYMPTDRRLVDVIASRIQRREQTHRAFHRSLGILPRDYDNAIAKLSSGRFTRQPQSCVLERVCAGLDVGLHGFSTLPALYMVLPEAEFSEQCASVGLSLGALFHALGGVSLAIMQQRTMLPGYESGVSRHTIRDIFKGRSSVRFMERLERVAGMVTDAGVYFDPFAKLPFLETIPNIGLACLGRELKTRRGQCMVSTSRLCEILDIDERHLRNYYNGKQDSITPRFRILCLMLRVFPATDSEAAYVLQGSLKEAWERGDTDIEFCARVGWSVKQLWQVRLRFLQMGSDFAEKVPHDKEIAALRLV